MRIYARRILNALLHLRGELIDLHLPTEVWAFIDEKFLDDIQCVGEQKGP